MNILFVTPTLGWTDSAAIASLSAVAKQMGHRTYYQPLVRYESRDKHDRRHFEDAVQQIRPRVIAYSSDTAGWQDCVEANYVANELHGHISIAGGAHPTQCPESFMASGMDCYCIGEGERSWEMFLNRLDANSAWDDVPNLITPAADNPVQPLIQDLDLLPMPDRDLILGSTFLHNTEKKTFFTSRGCPHQCAYCQNDTWHRLYRGKGRFVRRFSPGRVIREMQDVRSKHTMKFVKIDDDLFATTADDWLRELAREYKRHINLPFNCLLRVDRIDGELLEVLRDMGCYSVHLSVDSTNPRVREQMLNRRYGDTDIPAALRLCRKYGIATWVNYMLCIPTGTEQDDLATIAMSRAGNVTYASYTMTVPTPGTALYRYAEQARILPPDYDSKLDGAYYGPSLLLEFSERQRSIGYNVLLLGAMIAKLPWPLWRLAAWLLKWLPTWNWFKRVRQYGYSRALTRTVYKLG